MDAGLVGARLVAGMIVHGESDNIVIMPVRVTVDGEMRGDGFIKITVEDEVVTDQQLLASESLDLRDVSADHVEVFIKDPLDAISYTAALVPEEFGRDQ